MRTKAYTLIESLITLMIAIFPLFLFNVPLVNTSTSRFNKEFTNLYIHQQYLAILHHQRSDLKLPDIHQTEIIQFNQKGNVNHNPFIQLSKHESPLHITFVTGRIYESEP